MEQTEEHLVSAPPPESWDGVLRSYVPQDPLAVPDVVRRHTAAATEIDPITFAVVRYALLNANFEHASLIQRLCISPVTMLTRDYQTSVLTEDGDLVFLGPLVQYFSNSHSLSIKWILERRGENPGIAPGDMFLTNDPYVGAPHQSDTAILAPVFVGDQIFCWVANMMHLADVGGSVQGSFCITADDAWGDPPNFPPIKIVEGGTMRSDVEDVFVRQSRLPAAVRMDLRAAVTAAGATQKRLEALVERYGEDVVKGVMRRVLDAGESLLRERMQSIPDGRWSHRAFTECAVPGDREVYAYQINVTKQGDRLIVDNEGTDPQVGSINVTYAAFAGAVLAALTQQMVSELAGAYGGAYRVVEFRPTPGLLNCADYPAAVSPSGAYTTEMQLNAAVIAIGKMLSCGDEAARSLILGPNLPHFYGAIGGGLDPAGQLFIFVNTNGMIGALGGMPYRDGVDAGGHYWIPEGIAYNIEDLENQYPVLFLYRRLMSGGADGAGRHRGGLGLVEAAIPWNSLYFAMQIYFNDSFPKGQGQLGANAGSRAWFRARRGTDVHDRLAAGVVPQSLDDLTGEDQPVAFKGPPLEFGRGDAWEWSSPSAGGFGDPLRRDPEAALADVQSGLFTAEAVKRVYGVVLQDGSVDQRATDQRRGATLRERLGGETPKDLLEPPADALHVGDLLHVVDGRWWCNGADLGPCSESYKGRARRRELPIREHLPEFATDDHDMADKIVIREFFCPVTGYRIDTEIARIGEPLLADMTLALGSESAHVSRDQ